MKIQALGLFVLLVPVEIEPLQAFEDRGEGGVGVAFDVGGVDSEDHGSVIVARVEPIEYEGAGAADVEESGGGGGETDSGAEFGGGVGHILWSGVIGVSMLRSGKRSVKLVRIPSAEGVGC